MPLTEKGEAVKAAMEKEYGSEKGKQVFYATENKGSVKGLTGDSQLELELPEVVSASDIAAQAKARRQSISN